MEIGPQEIIIVILIVVVLFGITWAVKGKRLSQLGNTNAANKNKNDK